MISMHSFQSMECTFWGTIYFFERVESLVFFFSLSYELQSLFRFCCGTFPRLSGVVHFLDNVEWREMGAGRIEMEEIGEIRGYVNIDLTPNSNPGG